MNSMLCKLGWDGMNLMIGYIWDKALQTVGSNNPSTLCFLRPDQSYELIYVTMMQFRCVPSVD